MTSLPRLPAGILRSSSLAGGLINLFLGNILVGMDATTSIPLHPLAIAGFFGVIVNALGALPIGTTDGGRALLALLGRKDFHFAQSIFFPILILLALFGGLNSNLLFFAAFASITQLDSEIPCRDEATELGLSRSIFAFASFFVVALAVLPIPTTGL